MFDLVSIGDIKLDTFVVLDDASIQCELKDRKVRHEGEGYYECD